MLLLIPVAIVSSIAQEPDLAALKLPGKTSVRILEELKTAGYTFLSGKAKKTSQAVWIETYWRHPSFPALFEVDFYPNQKEADVLDSIVSLILTDLDEPLEKAKARKKVLEDALEKELPDWEAELDFKAVSDETSRTRLTINTEDHLSSSVGYLKNTVPNNFEQLVKIIASLRSMASVPKLTTESTLAPMPIPDDPLGATLKEAKLIHSDIGSFYKIMYSNSETKRTQAVYVRKVVYTFNSLKVQEVYSLCYDKPEPPSVELLQSTFQKRFTIGGLVLEAPSEKQPNWRIRYHMDAPSDLSPQRLSEYLQIVQGTADDLEKELNPGSEDKL